MCAQITNEKETQQEIYQQKQTTQKIRTNEVLFVFIFFLFLPYRLHMYGSYALLL